MVSAAGERDVESRERVRAISGRRVVDVEQAVAGIVGVERQAEQALLGTARRDQTGDVQERGRLQCAVEHDANATGAFDDEEPIGPVVRLGHRQWLAEAERDTARAESAGQTKARLDQTRSRESRIKRFAATFGGVSD